MAEDTIKLMDYLDIKKAHVLGISLGGMIAQELAIRHPERILNLYWDVLMQVGIIRSVGAQMK
jgi:pimeloyl-ACP methyl ester carboxylesterase